MPVSSCGFMLLTLLVPLPVTASQAVRDAAPTLRAPIDLHARDRIAASTCRPSISTQS